MNSISFSFLSIIMLFISGSIDAQTSRFESFPDRASSPYQQKAERMKRMDAFSERTFNPFFTLHGQIGLMSTFSKDMTRSIAPPIAVGINYRVSPTFSVGLQGSTSKYAADIHYFDRTYTTAVETTNRMLLVRINGHLPVGLRGEIYGGFGMGTRDTEIVAQEGPQGEKTEEDRIVRPQSGFITTAHVGGRYALTPRLGINGEIGSGLSLATVGISYRFR
ncbi:MAG: hypothetical protein AAF741_13215 [Bacteroidota bacterium]